MKSFNTLCRDKVTGGQMVLSECSFNQAAMYLDGRVQVDEVITINNKCTKFMCKGGYFIFDESRGYLIAMSNR